MAAFSPADLKNELRRRAEELGIPLFGVADVKPPPHARFVQEWVERGLHGGLGYMADTAEIRTAAEKLMPTARRVICLGMPHFHPGPTQAETPGDSAFIARYAWGRDYHNLLGKRLKKLCRWLRDQGVDCTFTVDTKPLLEKAYAVQAGLGFMGRNTLLIHPVFGSHIHLACILLDAELPVDEPLTVNCGTCRACQPACPTAALDEDYVLDAGACFSNHTIEMRGTVPESYRGDLPNLLFGCDICQDVCPFNREVPEAAEPDTMPRPGRPLSTLEDLSSMAEDQWLTWSEGSPLRRQNYDGFRRMLKTLKDPS